MRLPWQSRRSCEKISTAGFCRSTELPRGNMRTSPPHAVPPDAPSRRLTAKLQRSLAPRTWRPRRGTFGISTTAASRLWTLGWQHERPNQGLRALRDLGPAHGRGPVPAQALGNAASRAILHAVQESMDPQSAHQTRPESWTNRTYRLPRDGRARGICLRSRLARSRTRSCR